MDSQILKHFMRRYYIPKRTTIAAVNADHDDVVKWAEKYFVEQTPIWANDSEDIPPIDESIAQYTGGIIKVCLCLFDNYF